MMSSVSTHRIFSSFTALNLTQFFAAFNDNLFKLLLAYFVITVVGAEHSNTVLSVAGAIYVAPFILFAPLAGTLADRYSKRTVIYLTRLLDILAMACGVIAFFFNAIIWIYVVLFFMAIYSAVFSPCKYGIIAEIVPKEKVARCNGIITGGTYLAIILGTFFASFITEITHKDFVIGGLACLGVAIMEMFLSLGIEKTKPQAPRKKFLLLHYFHSIFRTLKKARRRRYLFTTMLFGAFFLTMAAYTQLNMIPYTIQSLHMSEVEAGYLFLTTAIGIGVGSYLTGLFSVSEVELGITPIAGIGVGLSFIGLFIFDSNLIATVIFLIGVGLFGGCYIVPIDTFIQMASPQADRGQNMATFNFLSFIGIIMAAGLLALLGNVLDLTAAAGFLTIGVITIILGSFLLLLFADQVLRFVVASWAKYFCHFRVSGKEKVNPFRPLLLVAPRTNWLDTVVVMATLPRLISYIVPIENGKKKRPFLYHLLSLIPLDIEHFSPIGQPTIQEIRKELRAGHAVCLMQPVDMPSKNLQEWEDELNTVLKDIHAPIMPIHISRKPPEKTGHVNELMSLRKGITRISYGNTKG